MKPPAVKAVRCAIYTRVSTEHGLKPLEPWLMLQPLMLAAKSGGATVLS